MSFQTLLQIQSHSHKPQPWHQGSMEDWVESPWKDSQQDQQQLFPISLPAMWNKSADVDQSWEVGLQVRQMISVAWEDKCVKITNTQIQISKVFSSSQVASKRNTFLSSSGL